MRILKFNVSGQRLEKDSGCDFSHIVKDSRGYLYAKFTFEDGWDSCKIAASFWRLGIEYPVLLDRNKMCAIPDEALTWNDFSVSCLGMKDEYRISTNKITIEQEG